jgi:hypothetical protein
MMLSSVREEDADWRGDRGARAKNLVTVVRREESEKFGWEPGCLMALVATGVKIKKAIERPM